MRALFLALAIAGAPAMAAAQGLDPGQVTALPSSPPTLRAAYGPGKLQVGELRVPPGKGPFPVAVIVHGGCWTSGFASLAMTSPMATALTAKGFATWNIEYRQLGDTGGGWPGTFQDWGAALDHLRVLARTQPLDLGRVVVLGHSAGGLAAPWLAARPGLPKGSPIRGADPLRVATAVDIDGPADLRLSVGALREACEAPVIAQLMGGDAAAQPGRYNEGNPGERLPLHTRQLLVSAALLSPEAASAYAAAARASGDRVTVLVLPKTGHFDLVAPGQPAWGKVEAFIVKNAFS
ncbi:alpha/beta hydrolase [Phenylobacterium sp.]|uniref:alpha/beta hydrolase family protein n=1 Tax=Phenylobacterium sp. TaxID=1871053 RepID=UPI00121BCFC8|nr:alpha/beta hydrolase [Phenylobacterium sp.]THD59509.1 MAG: alpha/beta hydrolase [Phenylobacterium sp.]